MYVYEEGVKSYECSKNAKKRTSFIDVPRQFQELILEKIHTLEALKTY